MASDIRELRVNFNASGDRMDADCKLWFAYPRPTRDTKRYADTELPIKTDGIDNAFRYNADLLPIEGTESPWLFTSGVEGPAKIVVHLSDEGSRSYDVQLLFAETDEASAGDRVFDVKIQGKVVASAFDVASESGGANRATTCDVKAVTAEDAITIELIPVQGKPPRVCSLVITENQ
jgi:hypothetical protein